MRLEKSLLSVAALVSAVLAPPAAAQAGPDLTSISFMVGCWAEPSASGDGLREFYAPPSENMLTGLSQFWQGGRIVDFEFHRVDSSPTGPVRIASTTAAV